MAARSNKRSPRTRPRRPLGGPSRLARAFDVATALAGAAVALGLLTAVLSWGRPPHLGSTIVRVESLPSGGSVIYGRITGSFGPLRRGFGQWVGPAGIDLLTPEDRVHSLSGRIEEPRWQAVLWPPNWWRRELWFVEALPPTRGFDRVRVRLVDRLGNVVLGPAVRLDQEGTPGDELPADMQAWGKVESFGAGFAATVDAGDLELDAPRR